MANEKTLIAATPKPSDDPFRQLPRELAFKLFSYLSATDRIALLRASAQIKRPPILLQSAAKSRHFFTNRVPLSSCLSRKIPARLMLMMNSMMSI
jgi:hypothetical protein